jgi:hypothetical protein
MSRPLLEVNENRDKCLVNVNIDKYLDDRLREMTLYLTLIELTALNYNFELPH